MDRPFRCSQLAKKGIALISSLFLAFALCMAFAPATAKADTVKKDVAIEDCDVIGTYTFMEEMDINYIALDEAADVIVFTDLADLMDEGAQLFNPRSNTYYFMGLEDMTGAERDSVYEAPIRLDAQFNLTEFLEEDDNIELDSSADSLDFSNAYIFILCTEDYENAHCFIVQLPAAPAWDGPFVPSVGTSSDLIEDGYTYSQWVQDESGNWVQVENTSDLYVLTVPYGTSALELDFKGVPLIAYGYDEWASYIDTGAADKINGYGNNGQIGEVTASFNADSKGELPAYIWVQTPYDENWSSTMLYAIEINYTASFTVVVDGQACTVLSFTPDGYTGSTYGPATTVGAYTVEIPQGTESVDLYFSDDVQAYNYKADGETYLDGAQNYPDVYAGKSSATVATDFNADGEFDCIQIQSPYDTSWNSTLYYVITFEYERVMPDDVIDIYMRTRDLVWDILDDGMGSGTDWFVMGMARGWSHMGFGPYFANIAKTLQDNDGKLGPSAASTDYSRTILALTAAHYDASDLGGYDLTKGLADYDAIDKQGVNAAIYALLAFDSHDYVIPEADAGATQTTREKLIENILSAQLADGGWDYMGTNADPDLTAMAIQALAKYVDTDANVKAAVDKAVAKLSDMQLDTGGFASWGSENSMSASQVIVALTELGIDPDTDSRFIKNGKSVLDALCTYACAGGGFGWVDTNYNLAATQQGFYALVAYNRFVERETSLYDMTDVYPKALPVKIDGTKYHIVSAFDDAFVLDVAAAMPEAGSNVSIWTNNGGDNQLFTFDIGDRGGYVIRNVANPELVLDAAGAVPQAGSNVSTWTANGGTNQEWNITLLGAGAGDDMGYMVNIISDALYLDAAGSEPQAGANVGLWTGNGQPNQLWWFVEENDLRCATAEATGMTKNIINGKAVAPEVTLTMGSDALVEGTDYKLYYDDGTNVTTDVPTVAGKYVVTAKAVDGGKYFGEKKIGTFDLSNAPEGIEAGKAYRIVSAFDDNFILDVAGAEPVSGANVSIWTSNGGSNQLFTVEASDNGNYVLRNVANTDLVLDAEGEVPQAGGNISTWAYHAALNQEWVFVPSEKNPGYFMIQSVANPEVVLDAAGSAPEIGANVGVWTANDGPNQAWKIVSADNLAYADVKATGMAKNVTGGPLSPDVTVTLNGKELSAGTDYALKFGESSEAPSGHGTYMVTIEGITCSGSVELGEFTIYPAPVPKGSTTPNHLVSAFSDDFVLDVAGAQPVSGANVSIWTSNGGANQMFTIELQDSGYYVLRNFANPDLVLDAEGEEPQAGGNVSTWQYHEALNQQWVLVPSEKTPGFFMIQSVANPAVVLDAAGSAPQAGANVGVWTLNDGPNQLWKVGAGVATEFPYDGDNVKFINAAGGDFGMFGPQEGTTIAIEGDNVVINYVPKNKTIYKGFFLNADISVQSTWKDDSYFAFDFDSETFSITLPKSYCGYAWPVVPNKVKDPSATTADQYYLAIPSEDKLTPAEPIELVITNNTGMFKAATASAVANADGSATLTFTLSGSSYHWLYKGTYEQAVAAKEDIASGIAADTGSDKLIKGVQNSDGKWEFQTNIAADELGKDVPVVSISDTYYQKYLQGQNAIERSFYPRQFALDLDAKTLVVGDFEASKVLEVSKETGLMMSVSSATLEMVGGPNSNNYKADLVMTMGSASYSKAFVGTPDEAAAATETIAIADDRSFTIPVKWVATYGDPTSVVNLANGEPFVMSFWSVKNEEWYPREITLNEAAGTLYLASWTEPVSGDSVDDLIAKIQVQYFTDTTWADCEAAKAAWDALSDEEKLLVEEYDYFGRDTGDASADNPLNQDGIGENEILVVSFGTSFNNSRAADIGGVEKAIQAAYPDWSVRRAFTAQIIINHIYARDGVKIDNMQQALDRAVANGVKNLVVQPTHLMHGAEYDELVAALAPYESKFESVKVAEPLLGEVGADASVVNGDKESVAMAAAGTASKAAGFDSVNDAAASGTAIVFMGHGTAHNASITYEQMQTMMNMLHYDNVFIGTVEGEPASTECSAVIAKVKAAGYTKVILRPLMVVAGDHANNDMADPEDEESWYSQFTAEGNFAPANVSCQIAGLGEIESVQQLYVMHTKAAIEGDQPQLINLSTATVTLEPESVLYDGQPHQPAITVAIGDKTLVADQDYTVSNGSVASTSDGTSVGKVVYTITGVESAGYTGIVTAEFTIKEPVVLEDGTYSLPELKSGPGAMFNHMVADSRFLKVEGDTATIIFTEDGSTSSVGKYSRLALAKSHDFIPDGENYVADSYLPAGTQVIEGTSAGTNEGVTMWHFEITLPKAEVEAMLNNGTVLDITVWNNTGSSSDKIPGWYRATNDLWLSLGQLGEKTA
ncbi:MAG: hypothetical protein E7003_04085 [Eggerthellaceae bacterium]|nr:hypothetical protein [Eggerthellaceae bacterium]